ncbi:MAG: hypothetical protein KAU38_03860 [Desulfobacterales bacterium]|nr:hypothetical protein [Desulfobacterales bacterium]
MQSFWSILCLTVSFFHPIHVIQRSYSLEMLYFEYDWRQDCTLTADLLDRFVDEVIARTKLLPHYRDEDFRVDLVGHSMGGLIIATSFYLPLTGL